MAKPSSPTMFWQSSSSSSKAHASVASRRRTLVLLGGALLTFFFLLSTTARQSVHRLACDFSGKCDEVGVKVQVDQGARTLPFRQEDTRWAASPVAGPTLNNTFGFQKVFLLNLERRRDRLSAVQLLLMKYDIAFDVIEGVDGKAERPAYSIEDQRRYGKVEGHAKVWQKMVIERTQSALILEDTFDMDVRIREQMRRLQHPFAMFQHILHGNATALSTHDGWNTHFWDMLWFGQCEEHPWDARPAKGFPILTYNDETRGEVGHYRSLYDRYDVLPFDGEQGKQSPQRIARIIQPANAPRCTTAYAMTLTGAGRALYQNTHKQALHDVDADLVDLIRAGRLRSLTVNPALFNARTAKDGSTNDGTPLGDAEVHHVPIPGVLGKTLGIEKSAREQYIKDLLSEEPVIIRQKNSF